MVDNNPLSPSERASTPHVRAHDFIEDELRSRLGAIESELTAHVLAYHGPIYSGADDMVRDLIEARIADSGSMGVESDRFAMILTTGGGQIEPVQRMVETIRHFYNHVAFVVPNSAYSAGTILCMSGDEIYMDYYSRLGPIDPQVMSRNGSYVPALGYLRRWDEFLSKEQNGNLSMAELQVMLSFDQAELYMYDQAEQQSIALLEDWLATYKFRNWTETETRKIPVTEDMKRQRARDIARVLNDSDRWHSHGHGISKDVLERDLNLQIVDLESNPRLGPAIKQYDQLLIDYMRKLGGILAIQTTSRPMIIVS